VHSCFSPGLLTKVVAYIFAVLFETLGLISNGSLEHVVDV
jgi:hypothetical protein